MLVLALSLGFGLVTDRLDRALGAADRGGSAAGGGPAAESAVGPRADAAEARSRLALEASGLGAEAPAEPLHPEEAELLGRLRQGDEGAFAALVDRYHGLMMRVASLYVQTTTIAEEVVQETWLAVVQGLDRFEGRSSLRTWMFRILQNRARTRAVREGRSVPLSTLAVDGEPWEPAVDASRFERLPDGFVHWAAPPRGWPSGPDARLLSEELHALVGRAIDALPETQRAVITMRDLEGMGSKEVCEVLGLTEANQRVLLHRARTKVRKVLEGADW